MKRSSLTQKLIAHSNMGRLPMHMPGHKRNPQLAKNSPLPYLIDLTEINGFDDLHGMTEGECLHEIARRAERLFDVPTRKDGTLAAYPLVCGSSGGILAAVRALTLQLRADGVEPRLLMSRNCHKSVWHAAELCRLHTYFLSPNVSSSGICGEITPNMVEHAMSADENLRIVIITSPTYEGVISDVKAIAEVVHKHGGYLILDAAHGAHLPFMKNTTPPLSNIDADIVITSLHKTLPALTQTALLLIYGVRVEARRVARELNVFETSSPSYVLLASVDSCFDYVEQNADVFVAYSSELSSVRTRLASLEHLSLLTPASYAYDHGKLVIITEGAALPNGRSLTGRALANILCEKYFIDIEMSAPKYIIAMTSPADMQLSNNKYISQNLSKFCDAIKQIDKTLIRSTSKERYAVSVHIPKSEIPTWEAAESSCRIEQIPAYDAIGRISSAYVWAYPPGIPLIAPGEIYDKDVIKLIELYADNSISLLSSDGHAKNDTVSVFAL